MMADGSEHKRQRVSKACEQCRKKKVKCDGGMPACTNCNGLGLECSYKESSKKRGPPKGYIEAIEGKLRRLETLLGTIVQEDDPRSHAILDELNAPLQTAYGEIVRPRPLQVDPIEIKQESEEPIQVSDVSSITENCGNLSIDESGQLRYYGKSSGFYMLNNSKNFRNRAFQFKSDPTETAVPLIVDPFEQPPDDLSESLLSLYFQYFYPLLPILHKKSFMETVRDKNKQPPLLLLNSIYALASRISSDVRVRADPDKPGTAGDVFFERARLLLDLEWDNFRVYTIQSLLLLSSHQNGALKPTRGWLYSGMAIRMSQNLGLHRNCDSWDLTPTEKEDRKRAFYACFVVDRMSSAMHGRSPMIDDRDYDAPYPSQNDEDDLHRKPRIMENFHHLIKLCEILGQVMRDIYMVKGKQLLENVSNPDAIISILDKKLHKWMPSLPADLQYNPPNTRRGETAPAPALELCQMHMLFYTTLILLHRPFIPGPNQPKSHSAFPSEQLCSFGANKILDITNSLFVENRLQNVNNYTLFYMFTAGMIFTHNASSSDSMFAFESKIGINKIMRAMDVVETTWITSARHCNILGALAGLRDIDLDCVDKSYNQLQKEKKSEPASIAVPNSPEPDLLDMSQRLEEKYYAEQSPISVETASPEINKYSLKGNFMENAFDPNETAFWGMPNSFNIDEWTSYFQQQGLPLN